jgi:hypothetical protein
MMPVRFKSRMQAAHWHTGNKPDLTRPDQSHLT